MRRLYLYVLFFLLLALAGRQGVLAGVQPPPTPFTPWNGESRPISVAAPPVQSQSTGLLVNGNFDQLSFYWRYPNHFVAGGWTRWWIHGTVLPEYDDARTRPYYDGGHAQVYFKWGSTYEAGIYQVVSGLTPCTPYRLTMWARNHSLDGVLPHARIGLDPQGTQLTPSDDDCAVKAGLPPQTVWSSEQTTLFAWEELSVNAEPVGDRLTAILYAHPQAPNDGRTYYFDTFWDAGSLITSTYPAGRLPTPSSWTPSGFITNVITSFVTSGVSSTLLITWTTAAPASTQVWYNIISPTSPLPLAGPYLVFLPLVAKAPSYAYATPVDITPAYVHTASVPDLTSGVTVQWVLLSRRLLSGACVTEVYGPGSAVVP